MAVTTLALQLQGERVCARAVKPASKCSLGLRGFVILNVMLLFIPSSDRGGSRVFKKKKKRPHGMLVCCLQERPTPSCAASPPPNAALLLPYKNEGTAILPSGKVVVALALSRLFRGLAAVSCQPVGRRRQRKAAHVPRCRRPHACCHRKAHRDVPPARGGG